MKQFLLLGSLALLLACSNPPTPPVENKAPIAGFTSATTVQAGTALGFSSTSSDPDGDALTLSWDFGNGVRGGGSSIAHMYTKAGSFTARLTAADGKGGVSSFEKTITVTANSIVAGAALSVVGTITDALGAPLAGVSVALDGTNLGSSDASGKVTVSVSTGIPINLVLNKTGYAEGFAALEFPIGSNASNADFKATLMARSAAQPLNASTGGTITGTDNARLELAANALVKPDGTPVTGSVNVSLSPVDINDPLEKNAFPGSFEGMQANGSSTGIVSLGTTEFALEQGGQRLNLKAGSSAKVRLPMYANTNLDGSPINLGDTIPLWSLNEQTGDWVQEGSGIVVDAGGGTRALEAVVTHFSWWNVDKNFIPSRPKPKCINDVPGQYDSIFEQATYCKFLAEIDKPIPAQGSSLRPQADPPQLPAYAATADVPMTGGLELPVPAGVNIRYRACIAGGAFCGSVVKNFVAGSSEAFEIRLKRTDTENINLPFDSVRNINSITRFAFESSTSPNGVSITLERSAGSSFTGTAVVINPQGNEISTESIGTTTLILEPQLLASGQHVLEIRPITGFSGALRIRVESKKVLPTDNGVWQTLDQGFNRFSFGADGLSVPNQKQLRMNALGNGGLLWVNETQNGTFIKASAYNGSSNTWEVNNTLETRSSQGVASQTALEIAPNNDLIALWSLPASREIRWSRKTSGSNAWSAAATLDTGTTNPLTDPQIRIDANGNAVATWLEVVNIFSDKRIRFAQFKASNSTWTVQTFAGAHRNGSARFDQNGNIHLFYENASSTVLTSQYNPTNDAWNPATTLFSNAASEFGTYEFGSNGNAMAVINQSPSPTYAGLRIRAYDAATSTWQPEQGFEGRNHQLGVDGNGNANLVYQNLNPLIATLARRYSFASKTWSNPETLSLISVFTFDAAFAANGDGVSSFAAVPANAPNATSLFASRASDANAWTTIIASAALNQEERRIAVGGTGYAILARTGSDNTGQYSVQVKRIKFR